MSIFTQCHDKYLNYQSERSFVHLRRTILAMTISVHSSSYSACIHEMFDWHQWQVLIRYFHCQLVLLHLLHCCPHFLHFFFFVRALSLSLARENVLVVESTWIVIRGHTVWKSISDKRPDCYLFYLFTNGPRWNTVSIFTWSLSVTQGGNRAVTRQMTQTLVLVIYDIVLNQ